MGLAGKLAYLDCSSGIAGDMFLGACLDAGVSEKELLGEWSRLPVTAYEFKAARVLRSGIAGTHVEIKVGERQPERHLHQIEELIENSALSAAVKQRSQRIFRRLAEVEGKLHDRPVNKVHFHEVGAVDAILDIVGACVCLELLGVAELIVSPLNVGAGRVAAAHGSLPVPAPATAELLRGVPIYSSGIEGELVTPTGAAIVTTLAAGFGPLPAMKVERIGYGAGTQDWKGQPNVARLFWGERASQGGGANFETVSVIEANLDDLNPQLYGYVVERALAAGALDVTASAIQMKKNRPGLLISVLCRPERADALVDVLFEETTTIGVRLFEVRRRVLDREWVSVDTAYGPVRVKVAKRDGRVMNAAPEYEDCRRRAAEKSVPLKEVIRAAQAAFDHRLAAPRPAPSHE
jgi:uncharacterized protein (TIGR00299 family) protein